MSRNPAVEVILQARYDWQNREPAEKAARLRHYHELLDQAIARTSVRSVTRQELEILLADEYREFKRAKRLEERARLSRLR